MDVVRHGGRGGRHEFAAEDGGVAEDPDEAGVEAAEVGLGEGADGGGALGVGGDDNEAEAVAEELLGLVRGLVAGIGLGARDLPRGLAVEALDGPPEAPEVREEGVRLLGVRVHACLEDEHAGRNGGCVARLRVAQLRMGEGGVGGRCREVKGGGEVSGGGKQRTEGSEGVRRGEWGREAENGEK